MIAQFNSYWWLFTAIGVVGLILLFKSVRKTGWTLAVLASLLLVSGEIATNSIYQTGMLEHFQSKFSNPPWKRNNPQR